MYFVAMTIPLQLHDRQTPLCAADGLYAHAAIIQTISSMDREAGSTLHDMYRHKRMSLAFIESTHYAATLRLTFMAPDGLKLGNLLVNGLSRHPTLQLGRTYCNVGAIDLSDSAWSGLATWADLSSETGAQRMSFTFAAPTAITKRDAAGHRFMALLPEPDAVFGGLAKRWRDLGGPQLPQDLDQSLLDGSCVISNYALHSVEFHTSERTQIGFVGHVVYECRYAPLSFTAALSSLTRFAFFSGVGYQTARGMGAVRTTISA
jgi:CRISPR-associated endoribonuclease Cas6